MLNNSTKRGFQMYIKESIFQHDTVTCIAKQTLFLQSEVYYTARSFNQETVTSHVYYRQFLQSNYKATLDFAKTCNGGMFKIKRFKITIGFKVITWKDRDLHTLRCTE